jgi:hypothetical protein
MQLFLPVEKIFRPPVIFWERPSTFLTDYNKWKGANVLPIYLFFIIREVSK